MEIIEGSDVKIPILSWCNNLEDGALRQAVDLSNHPIIVGHVTLMPDCHQGYGMPIGGIIACKNAVIPNAVGVDIGCGMAVIQTNYISNEVTKSQLRGIINRIKLRIPMGNGHSHRKEKQPWHTMTDFLDKVVVDTEALPEWWDEVMWNTANLNLGTLGSGNHFIEIQSDENDVVWLMLHSGSRNLGYQIAKYYHNAAKDLNKRWYSNIPCEDLAFLPINTEEGQNYIRDMNFALEYAQENRNIMMRVVKECIMDILKPVTFGTEINIHHNYAALEHHFGKNLWVHRKGATSARKGQLGIIPGSMGTASYIVEGLGNPASFQSCSHGAGRTMSRTEASKTLDREDCDKAMEGIVWDGFKKNKGRGKKPPVSKYDLSEAPGAYKDIDEVMDAQKDLVKILHKLETMAVLKG